MSNKKKPEIDDDDEAGCVYIEHDEDFLNYCRDMLVKSGRVKKTGNLKRTEDGESYVGDILYEMVLN